MPAGTRKPDRTPPAAQPGEPADPQAPRLPSVEPWLTPGLDPGAAGPDPADAARRYLGDTLELTLTCWPRRGRRRRRVRTFTAQALLHEDRLVRRWPSAPPRCSCAASPTLHRPSSLPVAAARELPGCRARLQLAAPGGFVPDLERWARMDLPEFEIDAQAVSWERYIEFKPKTAATTAKLSERSRLALAAGHAAGRPRDVEQLRGGVLVQRLGELQRATGRAGGAAPVAPRSRSRAAGRPPPAHRTRMGAGCAHRAAAASSGAMFESGGRQRQALDRARRNPGQFDRSAATAHARRAARRVVHDRAALASPEGGRCMPPGADLAWPAARSAAVAA